MCPNYTTTLATDWFHVRNKKYNYGGWYLEFENKVVGILIMCYNENCNPVDPDLRTIAYLKCDQNLLRQGICSRLLAFAVNQCEGEGVHEIVASCYLENHAAVKFFERHNFKKQILPARKGQGREVTFKKDDLVIPDEDTE